MHLELAGRMKSLGELQVGELSYLRVQGQTALIAPVDLKESGVTFAMFSGAAGGLPIVDISTKPRMACLSFGTEWALEPVIDQGMSGCGPYREAPGSIHFNKHGTVMFLGSSSRQDGRDGFALNLGLFEPSYIDTTGFCTLRWRIWVQPPDARMAGSRPLYEFDGTDHAR